MHRLSERLHMRVSGLVMTVSQLALLVAAVSRVTRNGPDELLRFMGQ
jgi:hypothetical protein